MSAATTLHNKPNPARSHTWNTPEGKAAGRAASRGRRALLLILLAGAALRLYRLGADSLWYDETVSTMLAGSSLPELIRHTAGDIHPPGYYALLRGWLLLAGYPAGQAGAGDGLAFAAGFFSLMFGVLLIALTFALARRLAGRRAALAAAALAAFSPYHIWYSQEVRMYTLAAGLGCLAVYALARAGMAEEERRRKRAAGWWATYALAAAAGMYTLYYFAFLLAPLNLWMLWRMGKQAAFQRRAARPFSSLLRLLLANLAAAALYAAWIPVAWQQATNPPVPPWRTAPGLVGALVESWTALSLGQSAATWLWPVLLLTLALYGLGLRAARNASRAYSPLLPLATLGPLAAILLASLVTPLYHVRYLFTYSPAFYIVLGGGLAWLWRRSRAACGVASVAWLAAAGVTLAAFWSSPLYRADDHCGAVRFLQERWRPGDVVLVNAGWAYTALNTYWDGAIATRTRLTDALPAPRDDAALVMVTTGHVGGAPGLGWGDPRADFFALPADQAERQITALFQRFTRVWHYRIYDTVNDPEGRIRGQLAQEGQGFEDEVFPGEAFMRVQGFLPRAGGAPGAGWLAAAFPAGLAAYAEPLPKLITSGETLYPRLAWLAHTSPVDFATSVRLVTADGITLAQGADERPAGPGYPASQWTAGRAVRQTARLPIPADTPPGMYRVEFVVYDPATGLAWPAEVKPGGLAASPNGVWLGEILVSAP